ncbi:DDT domain [Dillenia turbinata]|uniref:DDT domain n=1 Tax=Dillenia turbinata TaxID=194707 RepID=A0AAN8Z270_9MAGN
MPLFRRKAFPLLEPPKDLDPRDLVFQVRFTKEIFRDYREYLNRINLYRQRVWTCKVSGKTNLTYEEALVSERRASEKVQQFPKDLILPVLQTVQFSMLSLRDLVSTITAKLQECLSEGAELYGRKDDGVHLCKIIKVLEDETDKSQYEVVWLDNEKKITGSSILSEEDLLRKKLPFTREVLKSFIRESTYQSFPWMLHEKLACKHGIAVDPPVELRSKMMFRDGQLVSTTKRRSSEEGRQSKSKKKKSETDSGGNAEDQQNEEPLKYPIDDLMVRPGADDPVFTDRPLLSRDFSIPMDSVGDLLMVWDFCSSFGRLLCLSPFSLADFENAINHKDGNSVLLVETHAAILRLLIRDDGEYLLALQDRRRKSKITMVNWADYLCDFLEMVKVPELSTNIAIIKRGHYCLVDPQAKLRILHEMVDQALETDLFREKLDENIEQRQSLASTRREEAIEAARKKREEKERIKADIVAKENIKGHGEDSVRSGLHVVENGCVNGEIGDGKERLLSSQPNHALENGYNCNLLDKDVRIATVNDLSLHIFIYSDSKDTENSPNKMLNKQKMNKKISTENRKDPLKKKAHVSVQQDDMKEKKEAMEKSVEQRKEYLEREIEKCVIRTNPLGKDRHYNKYWFFLREGRIFIESSDSKQWGYYRTREELDALIGSLNPKGERERALKKQLDKHYGRISLEMQKRSKDVAQKIALEEAVLRRSTRVRAPPRENPAHSFLRYVNKWKED